MGFFKSFFSGKSDSPANEKQKNEQKNFEIFKYDRSLFAVAGCNPDR